MATLFQRIRKKLSQGGVLLVLQGTALVLGPGATPSCAYGPPENGWDDLKEDLPFYDGRNHESADDLLPELGVVDDIPTQEVDVSGRVTDLYGPEGCCGEDIGEVDDIPKQDVDVLGRVTDLYGPEGYGGDDQGTMDDADSQSAADGDVSAGWYGATTPDIVDQASADDVPGQTPDTNCGPMGGMYGPPPCGSDTDCASYGEGYYCNKSNEISDSCGNPMNWPVCEKK